MSGSTRDAKAVPATSTSAVPVPLGSRTAARPLDAAVRRPMEARFGHDFSKVRVHTGDAAERSAALVGARAYAVESDLVFGPGQFAPETPRGQKLLAHELAHVVQRSQPGSSGDGESRARAAADDVVGGERVGPAQLGSIGPGVHRDGPDSMADLARRLNLICIPWPVLLAQLPKLRAPTLGAPAASQPIFDVGQLQLGAKPPAADWSARPPAIGGGLTPLTIQTALAGSPVGPVDSTAQVDLAQGPSAKKPPPPPLKLDPRLGTKGDPSFGLRFGMPAPPDSTGLPPERRPQGPGVAGEGPSPLAYADYQGDLAARKVPSLDVGQLIQAGVGILSQAVPELFAPLAKVAGGPGQLLKIDGAFVPNPTAAGLTFTLDVDRLIDPKLGKKPK